MRRLDTNEIALGINNLLEQFWRDDYIHDIRHRNEKAPVVLKVNSRLNRAH